MPRKTIADLEAQIKNLQPYQEAYFCTRAGSPVHTVTSGDRVVKITGVERLCGGVIIEVNDSPSCSFAVDTCVRFHESGDPYLREIVSKIHKLQKEALDAA